MAARRQPVDTLELRLVLLGVNPLIWRHLLVPTDASVVDLHDTLQIAMGREDVHLHRFHIRGRDYGVSRIGGLYFADDAHDVRLGDLGLRCGERFVYEYDMGDLWVHQIRLEHVVPADPRKRYPRAAPAASAPPPPPRTAVARRRTCRCATRSRFTPASTSGAVGVATGWMMMTWTTTGTICSTKTNDV